MISRAQSLVIAGVFFVLFLIASSLSSHGAFWTATWVPAVFFVSAAIGPDWRAASIAKKIFGMALLALASMTFSRLIVGGATKNLGFVLVLFSSGTLLIVDPLVRWLVKEPEHKNA